MSSNNDESLRPIYTGLSHISSGWREYLKIVAQFLVDIQRSQGLIMSDNIYQDIEGIFRCWLSKELTSEKIITVKGD